MRSPLKIRAVAYGIGTDRPIRAQVTATGTWQVTQTQGHTMGAKVRAVSRRSPAQQSFDDLRPSVLHAASVYFFFAFFALFLGFCGRVGRIAAGAAGTRLDCHLTVLWANTPCYRGSLKAADALPKVCRWAARGARYIFLGTSSEGSFQASYF